MKSLHFISAAVTMTLDNVRVTEFTLSSPIKEVKSTSKVIHAPANNQRDRLWEQLCGTIRQHVVATDVTKVYVVQNDWEDLKLDNHKILFSLHHLLDVSRNGKVYLTRVSFASKGNQFSSSLKTSRMGEEIQRIFKANK